jgi:rod shape-determining protein MreD
MGAPWWIVTGLLFICALVQASLLPSLGLATVRPDIVLQCVVIWAVLRGVREALPWAFVGGLLLDLFSAGPFGTAALAMVLVAFCSSAGQFSVFRSNFLLPVLIVFPASLLYGVVFLFLLRTHQLPVDWIGALQQTVMPNAIVNTALAPLAYAVLVRLERRTRSTVAVDW